MHEISLLDADGREPLPICRAHREWLVRRYHDTPMIAYRYFSDDLPVSGADASVDQAAVRHLRQCPRCRQWLHAVTPPEVMKRQHRMSRYCCAQMFVAVEEYDKYNTPRIRFTMFRGEDPCWMIDDHYAFIQFCPWCGKPMPDQPFLEDTEASP